MKNGKFETQTEIYRALLDGKVVTNGYMILNLVNGNLCYYGTTSRECYSFNTPKEWSLYEEPKAQAKVKIVAHLFDDGDVCLSTDNSRLCASRDETSNFKRIELTPEMFGWKELKK